MNKRIGCYGNGIITEELRSLFDLHLMSSRDISAKYGKSRQYWDKIMKQGKIVNYQVSAGRITFDKFVEDFIDKVDPDKVKPKETLIFGAGEFVNGTPSSKIVASIHII